MGNNKTFFDEPTEASKIKVNIVTEFFEAWSAIIHYTQERYPRADKRLAYWDLYAGKGKYDDGTPSIPLLILQRAVQTPYLCQKLVTIFNEGRRLNAEQLKKNITEITDIAQLVHQPRVECSLVELDDHEVFENVILIPSLFFLDPFGYAGLSSKLLHATAKDWGSDCIFLFNYSRVNAAINNDKVRKHADAFFGHAVVEKLRTDLRGMRPPERERHIMSELNKALTSSTLKYTRTFRFRRQNKDGTSHYLVYATKNEKGYTVMTDIMAKHSSVVIDGFASFEYNPVAKEKASLAQLLIKPADILKAQLVAQYSGQCGLTVLKVFLEHSPGTSYRLSNYKKVLNALFKEGRIIITGSKQPRGSTFADDIEFSVP